ncbi:MAG TPA: hypothetical protein VFU19_19135 [Iamia sp.]|nr:hypothetical protein [Iamia sp.]
MMSSMRWRATLAHSVVSGSSPIRLTTVPTAMGAVAIRESTTRPSTALTVADIHTFFVQAGSEWILTHNTDNGCGIGGLD